MRGFLEYVRLSDRPLMVAALALLPIAWLRRQGGQRRAERAEHEFIYTVF